MPITNNNLPMIDGPVWEQLTSAPAATAAGSAFVDDGSRFLYILFSAASFWRYDAWAFTWQQLANPPGGTLAAGSCLRYVAQMGSQENGEVFGSVYALIASGTAVVFYRYNIGTNAWTAALTVTNVPAAWGTDGRLMCPEPACNAYAGGYHSAVALNTITTTALAAQGATSIAVTALPLALPIGAVLNFGTAAAPIHAVLTVAAAAAATSVTVSALIAQVPSAAVAYWYADLFLMGNNATPIYRYNIVANAWVTTSANAANPALPAAPGTLGAGTICAWLPGSGAANALNSLIVVSGAGRANIYEYNLVTNAWSTLTFQPATETFTTATSSGIRNDATGRAAKLLIQKEQTGRVYEFNRLRLRLDPQCTQNIIPSGAALAGDKMAVLRDPSGKVEFLYVILSTSAYFLRTPLVF